MARPKVSNSEIVLDKFFKVRSDKLDFPDGNSYEHLTVEIPETVSIVIFRNDKITLVGQYRHSTNRLMWSTPSGYINEGETPEAAIIRESQEEVGLKPLNLTHLISTYTWSGISPSRNHIFFATDFEESKLEGDATEDLLVREFSFAEVTKFLDSKTCDESFALGMLRAKEKGLISF